MQDWNEIASSEEYKNLPDTDKSYAKAGWFHSNFGDTKEYKNLSDDDKDAALAGFLNIPEDPGPEPGYTKTFAQGVARGAEGLAGSVGSGMRWAGEVAGSEGLAEQGKMVSDFWKKEAQEGWEAQHPKTFGGSFIENPSLKRGVGIVGEAAPSMALGMGATGFGMKVLGLGPKAAAIFGGSSIAAPEAAGDYEQSREAGSTVSEATLHGGVSGIGTAILESVPLGRMFAFKGGRIAGGIKGAFEEGAQEATQSVWQNIIAKMGYDDSRNLAEGVIEGFIGGFGMGGPMGAITANNKLSEGYQKAKEAGVSDDELQAGINEASEQTIGFTKDNIIKDVTAGLQSGKMTVDDALSVASHPKVSALGATDDINKIIIDHQSAKLDDPVALQEEIRRANEPEAIEEINQEIQKVNKTQDLGLDENIAPLAKKDGMSIPSPSLTEVENEKATSDEIITEDTQAVKAAEADTGVIPEVIEGVKAEQAEPTIAKPEIVEPAKGESVTSEGAQAAIDDYETELYGKYGKDIEIPVYAQKNEKINTPLTKEELSHIQNLYDKRDVIDKTDLSDFVSQVKKDTGLSETEASKALAAINIKEGQDDSVYFAADTLKNITKSLPSTLSKLYNHFSEGGDHSEFRIGGTVENLKLEGRAYNDDLITTEWDKEALRKTEAIFNAIAKNRNIKPINLSKITNIKALPPPPVKESLPEKQVDSPFVGAQNMSVSRTTAKKQADGKFKLFFTGTRNEVFPGKIFKSAPESKQYFKTEQIKYQESQKSPTTEPGKQKAEVKEKAEITGDKEKTVSVDMPKKEADALSPKEQKAYLLAEIDKAIEQHEKDNELEKGAVEEFYKIVKRWDKSRHYTFEVPGDGEFEIDGNTLVAFKQQVSKNFPTVKTVPSFRFKSTDQINYIGRDKKIQELVGDIKKFKPEDIQSIKDRIENAKKKLNTEEKNPDKKFANIPLNYLDNWLLSNGASEEVINEIKRSNQAEPSKAEGKKEQYAVKKIDKTKDAEYLKAVESGDMESAQKMVDDAARKAGYISGEDYRMMHQAPDRENINLSELMDSDTVPNDYWTEPQYYQADNDEYSSFNKIKSAIEREKKRIADGVARPTKIWMYRAVPKNIKDSKFRNGDWISPSRSYAKSEGLGIPEGYRVIAERVNISDVWWDTNSINEFGYDDGKEYAYKNTKNNRKLVDVVTKSSMGKIIPLSERFNSRKFETQYSTKTSPLSAKTNLVKDIQSLLSGAVKSHGVSVGTSENGNVWVRTKNGHALTVEFTDTIEPNKEAFNIGYQKEQESGEIIAGSYQGNVVKISDVGDKWTVAHEMFGHWLEDTGLLTNKDLTILDRRVRRFDKFKGLSPQEARASYIAQELENRAKYRHTALGRTLQKIADFIDGLVSLIARTSRNVIKGVESGKVFNQEGSKTAQEGMPLYSTKHSDFADKFLERYETKKETPAEVVKKIKEEEKHFNGFLGDMVDIVKNINKGYEGKKDTTLLGKIFRTPEFWKIPTLKRLYETALKRPDAYHHTFNRITQSESGEDYVHKLRILKKQDKSQFQEVQGFITKSDRNKTRLPYDVVNPPSGGDIYSVYKAKRSKDAQPIARFKTERDAWDYTTAMTASDMIKQGVFTEQGADAWLAYRQIMDNGLELLQQDMEDLIQKYEDLGMPLPEIAVRMDGESVKIDLKAALAKMGEMKGFYAPRLRPPGKFKLIATKEGTNPIMEFSDSKAVLSVRENALRKQGYSVKKDVSGKMPEDVFEIAGNTIGTQALINQALSKIGSSEGIKELKEIGIKTEWRDFADGSKSFIAVADRPKLEYTQVFEALGFKSHPRGLKGREFRLEWELKNAQADIEEKLTDKIFETAGITPDTDLLFATQLANQVANIIRGRGFRSSMIKRDEKVGKDVWMGYEEDPLINSVKYARGLAAGIAKKQMAIEMAQVVTGTDISWDNFKDGHENELKIKKFQQQIKELAGKKTKTEQDAKRKELAELRESYYREYLDLVKERRLDPEKQENAFREARVYMEDMLRNEERIDRIMGSIRGLAVIKYLGFRVSAPLVNLTALVTSVPATMNGYAGIPLHKTMRYIGIGSALYGKYKFGKKETLSPDMLRVFQEIEDKGWHTAQYNKEALSVLQSKFGRGYSDFAEWSMKMFGVTEQLNRVATIAGTYKAIKDMHKGKWTEEDHKVAMKLSKKVSDRGHGVYGKATLPYFARGKDLGAQIARAYYVFRKFSHNYLQTMWDLGYNKRQAKAALYMALSPAVIAGVGSSVLTPVIAAMLKAAGMDDPEEELYSWLENKHGETMSQYARYGVAGLGGYGFSIKGSLAIGIGDIPTNLSDVFGAPGSVMSDIFVGGKNLIQGDISKGFEKILPLSMGAPLKAIRESTEGVTTGSNVPVFYGNEQLRANELDAFYRALSFNPARMAGIREKQWKEKQINYKYSDKRQELYAQLKKFYLQPTHERTKDKYADILLAIQEYNERVQSKGIANRIPLITPRSIKSNLKRSFRPSKTERMR